MKKKVLLVTILLIIVVVSTLAFATDQQPINEEVAYTTEGVEEVSEEVVSEEVVVTNEDVETYQTIYDKPVSSSDGFLTVTLLPMPSGTTSFNYYYKNTGNYATTVSVEYLNNKGVWTPVSGSDMIVPAGTDDFQTITTAGATDFRIQLVNKNAGTFPISGQLRVAQY